MRTSKLRPAAQHEVRDARSGDRLGDACRQASVDHVPAVGLFRQSGHVAAISCQVTLLDAAASLVLSSEMAAQLNRSPTPTRRIRDRRESSRRVLQSQTSYAKTAGSCCVNATEEPLDPGVCDRPLIGDLVPACATRCLQPRLRQVAFTVESPAGCPIHLTKIYGLSHFADGPGRGALRRAEWTSGSRSEPGVPAAAHRARAVHGRFLAPQRCPVRDIEEERTKRSTVEIQQRSRFNLFHILQASRARGRRRRAGEGPHRTSRMRALFLGHRDLPAAVSDIYLPSDR